MLMILSLSELILALKHTKPGAKVQNFRVTGVRFGRENDDEASRGREITHLREGLPRRETRMGSPATLRVFRNKNSRALRARERELLAGDFVFDFHHGEVQFDFRLYGIGGEVGAHHVGENLAGLLEEALLLRAAGGHGLQGLHCAGQFASLGESVDDGEGGFHGLVGLKDGGEHIQAALREGSRLYVAVFQQIKLVKIFDQFLFL